MPSAGVKLRIGFPYLNKLLTYKNSSKLLEKALICGYIKKKITEF